MEKKKKAAQEKTQEAMHSAKTMKVETMPNIWKQVCELQANFDQLASGQKHVQQDAKATTIKGMTATPLIQRKFLQK